MKLFWVCDSETGYPLFAIPYLGKNPTESRAKGIGHQMVRALCKRYENSYRNVTMDNFFTSYELAQEMLGNGLTIVGTVRKNKKFIPPGFQANRRREIGSNLFAFRPHFSLLSHVPKMNKSVILLSTSTNHRRPIVNTDGKAEMIHFYNKTKGGVDLLDQMCQTYTCQRKTNRWPFAFFMNLLDVSGVAAYIIYIATHAVENASFSLPRRRFLRQLSDELVFEQIVRRSKYGLHNSHIALINEVRQSLSAQPPSPETPLSPEFSVRRRCYLFPSKRNRRVKTCCEKCDKNVCSEHSANLCEPCVMSCEPCAKRKRQLDSSNSSN